MNEVLQAIKSRRSIRKFKSDMVRQDEIDKIVEAGLYAASGMNRQSTKIIVIKNKELRDKFAAVNAKIGGWREGFDPFYGAPVVAVVLSDKDNPIGIYDGSLVIGNMMLAAHSLGIGSCWIHRAKEEFDLPEYQEFLRNLEIEGNWEGIGHCILGYADTNEPAALPRAKNRVYVVE